MTNMKKLPLIAMTALSVGLYSCDNAANDTKTNKADGTEADADANTEVAKEMPTYTLFEPSLTEGATNYTGYVTTQAEAEAWITANPKADEKFVKFLKSANLEDQAIFVLEYKHAGSGMDKPAAKSSFEKGVLKFEIYDSNESPMRTNDLRRTTYFLAAILEKEEVTKVVVNNKLVVDAAEQEFPLD